MKRLIAFLALLPLLAMGGGQYTIPWVTGANAGASVVHQMVPVQAVHVAITGGGAGPNWPVSFSATPANTSILIFCAGNGSAYPTFSLTTTQLLTYNPSGSPGQGMWVASGVTTGTTSLTIIEPGAYAQDNCTVAVTTGITTSSPLDVAANSGAMENSSYATSITTGSVTTTNANDVIIGVAYAPSNLTVGSGYTAILFSTMNGSEYLNVSATGIYNPPMTQASAGYASVGTVALKLQ